MRASRCRRAATGARRFAPAALLGAALAAATLAIGGAGCGSNCCTVDSTPIALGRAPRGDGMAQGGLLARAVVPGGEAFQMVVDTASPVTILAGNPAGTPTPSSISFDLLDARFAGVTPVRARFRGIGGFNLPVGTEGDAATIVGGVMGGDLLRAFSVDFRFGPPCPANVGPLTKCAAMTFWNHQGASNGFLSDAGYAVLRVGLMGGGETAARTRPDSFGLSAPVTLAPTRVVLRACAAPRAFSRAEPRELCCARGDELDRATGVNNGVNLSLVLATGAGPMVLSEEAWARVEAELILKGTAPPALSAPAPLHMASWPAPIPARWTVLPRFALVDLEAGTAADPGPCVELGRSRRIEWVVNQQALAHVAGATNAACVQLCDTDRAEAGKAQNSAAYIELAGAIPVAVVSETEVFLQALRFDIRPEGPEVDGLVGAGALDGTRLELDYRSDQPRAIFSCEEEGTAACHAAGRCPRLPDHEQKHTCFGLESHGLPATCSPSGC